MAPSSNMSALRSEVLDRLSVTRLPALPHVLVKLMALCQSENTTISDLAALIEQEPAMVQKILNAASSPAYNHTGQSVKLDKGLITLGTHMVRMLLINESVYQNFNNLAAFKNHDIRFFWVHSLKTAIIARKAARHMARINIDEAYLVGLLHDIGRLALLAIVPDLYQDMFYLPDSDDLQQKEREMLGIDHAEIGQHLIRQWEFQSTFANSIAAHHDDVPPYALPSQMALLIHMANRLAACTPGESAIETIATHYSFPVDIATRIVKDTLEDIDLAVLNLGIDMVGLDGPPRRPAQQPATPQKTLVEQDLNEKFSELLQASELGRFFSNFQTAAELQDAALKAACVLFSLDSAILLWQNHEADKYQIIAINKTVERLLNHTVVSTPQGAISQAFSRMAPIFISDVADLPASPELNIAKLLGGENWLLLPLAGNGQCPGLVFARLSKERLRQLQTDKYLLLFFGEQLVNAWIRVRETQELIQEKITQIEEQHRKLSREIAHELSNPLTVLQNYLFILNQQLEDGTQKKQLLSVMTDEIDRLTNLVSEMDNPSYFIRAKTETTNPRTLVQDIIATSRETGFFPDVIQVITHASSSLQSDVLVQVPTNLLKQVIITLMKNAVEAMPEGGSIMITHNGLVQQENKPYYHLSLRDTGPGIPEDVLKNLFLPATTTRGNDHQGLGLGLAYSLLNKVDALIGCQSESSGTTFNLLLPVLESKETSTK